MPSRLVRLLAIASACLGIAVGLAACGGSDDGGSVTLTKLPANPQNGSAPGKPETGRLGTTGGGGGGGAAGEQEQGGGSADAGGTEDAGSEAGGSGDDAGAEAGGEASGGGSSSANAAGKEIFTQSCAGCHTLADAGASGSVGPNLDDAKPDEQAVAAKVRAGGGGMPSFDGTLAPEQIDEVAAYVAAAAGS